MAGGTYWAIVAAFITAASAAGYSFWQKRRDFMLGRRSVSAAIYSEIAEACESLAIISLDHLEASVKERADYKPLLVVSSDIRVLERTKIEEWQFSAAVVRTVIAFQNTVCDYYECLRAINSDRFLLLDEAGKLRLVKLGNFLANRAQERGTAALEVMLRDMPEYSSFLCPPNPNVLLVGRKGDGLDSQQPETLPPGK